ncbi:MAG TPA: hypothetical protein VK203_08930 [Nostocaceae cyanobacterium]|nr:hypothetical protein [Nostocaceae cyanobacterium]
MNLTLQKIASVASVSLITMLVGISQAQSTQPQPALTAAKTTKISQRQTTLNKDLLVKAITKFWQSDRYLTESQSLITAKTQGGDFKFKINTKTIVQAGGKFRSEIFFTEIEDQTKQQYVVISDGKKVWTYNPVSQEYSISSSDNFQESFLIGVSSLVFIQFPEEARVAISQNQSSSEKILQEIGLLDNTRLKEEQGIVDNQQVSVYRYTEPEDGFNFSAFIEPVEGIVKQVQFGGQSSGFDILITEKILQRTSQPVTTAQTFKFSPPLGAKQVKSLSIDPF